MREPEVSTQTLNSTGPKSNPIHANATCTVGVEDQCRPSVPTHGTDTICNGS